MMMFVVFVSMIVSYGGCCYCSPHETMIFRAPAHSAQAQLAEVRGCEVKDLCLEATRGYIESCWAF